MSDAEYLDLIRAALLFLLPFWLGWVCCYVTEKMKILKKGQERTRAP